LRGIEPAQAQHAINNQGIQPCRAARLPLPRGSPAARRPRTAEK
jgi:hypothetical protein